GAIAAYPPPPPPTGWPQDTERVNSGPTARPYPPGQEPAPANYGAQQQVAGPIPKQPMPEQVGSGPTNRPQPAPPSDDPSQRPTDIVPQPVVSTGRQEASAAPTEILAQPGGAGVSPAPVEGSSPAGSAGLDAERSGRGVEPSKAGDVSGGETERPAGLEGDSRTASASAAGEEDSPDSPGFAELVAEPLTALARPVSVSAHGGTSGSPGDESPGGAAAESATGSTDFVAAEVESSGVSRHPNSGAFVPLGRGDVRAAAEVSAAADAGGMAEADTAPAVSGEGDTSETASVGAAAAESSAPEQVSGSEIGSPTPDSAAGVPVPADGPGYGAYGAVVPGGSGYGAPHGAFGPNVVRPGLIPTSQRAEASQVTALVVLGLAVVALVLMVVVAVVLVSG
ncbi:hypothetical protein, partial [Nocardia sp. JMUB6875]|uniref:hypothetical protein n=1 Tax=Nocardia sp. JMUB6875 TaxID=3158170 RepID=UPI0034E8911B